MAMTLTSMILLSCDFGVHILDIGLFGHQG